MKLLFVGIEPPAGLVSTLLAQGLGVDSVAKFPLPPKPASYDLLIFRPRSPNDLKALEGFRKRFNHAWIALVVSENMLNEPEWHNELLACGEKNAIWFEPLWEQAFFLQFQQALLFRDLIQEKEHLQQEYDELSRSSRGLVEKLERDVGLASSIQRSLLPKASPHIPGIKLAVKYIPASGQGGDYYDIFEFGDRKRYGIILADSRSHGMAAALLSVLLKIRIQEMKERFPDTRAFVMHLNQEIQSLHDRELSTMALLYAIVDRSRLQMQYCVAGHLSPLLWRAGKPFPLPQAQNPALGEMSQYDFQQSEIALLPGDFLIFHTDGLEAPLAGKKKGKAADRLISILSQQSSPLDPLEVQVELLGQIDAYLEHQPLPDDLTVIHLAVNQRVLYVTEGKRSKKGR